MIPTQNTYEIDAAQNSGICMHVSVSMCMDGCMNGWIVDISLSLCHICIIFLDLRVRNGQGPIHPDALCQRIVPSPGKKLRGEMEECKGESRYLFINFIFNLGEGFSECITIHLICTNIYLLR